MFEKRTPAEIEIEQGFLLVHLNAGTNGKPQACGMDCLADVALQLIQALLSVILGDNGAAGVDDYTSPELLAEIDRDGVILYENQTR